MPAPWKAVQSRISSPHLLFSLFSGERWFYFLLPILCACCSSGQDDWRGRCVPLSTVRNSLTSFPGAQMSPLILLMPVTLPLLLLMSPVPGTLHMQELFMKHGDQREPHTKPVFTADLHSPSMWRPVVEGWSSGTTSSALSAQWLHPQPCAPKYMIACISSPWHSSPSHWCEWVLYLPRTVMKIAMTIIVVAWECKELILPEY